MNYQKMVDNALCSYADEILAMSDRIFDYAEVGFKEVKSSSLFCENLEKQGFAVTRGICGMPTAFKASIGSGHPVIGLLAEYDALPGLSQRGGMSCKKEVEESEDGCKAGHGCGHNLLGAGVYGAALAIKEYLAANPEKGTIILYGCPSEEKGNGKTIMARDGEFDDLDAAFSWHPGDRNMVTSYATLANISVYFDFKGVTSHAAAAPQFGRSALDAAELMSVGVNYLREHIIQEARIHYAYIDVGGNAPNVVQGSSRVHYFIRAPKTEQVLEIFERVKDIATGAALMTGTKNSLEIFSGLSDFVPNRVLSEVLQNAMEETGAPDFDENDFAAAVDFFKNAYLPEEVEQKERQIKREFGENKGTQLISRPLDTEIAPLNFNFPVMPGSTDVGDVSHAAPTAQLSYATETWGTAMHTWQATAHGNTSIAHKALLAASKAIALAAIQVLENPELAKKAKEAWIQETGGTYICPITKDVKPRLDD